VPDSCHPSFGVKGASISNSRKEKGKRCPPITLHKRLTIDRITVKMGNNLKNVANLDRAIGRLGFLGTGQAAVTGHAFVPPGRGLGGGRLEFIHNSISSCARSDKVRQDSSLTSSLGTNN
jgi:hypothetical protein